MTINVRNIKFANLSVKERLKWAYEKFDGEIVATSSFQSQSVPLLYLISKTIPDIEILFLNTGFHFPETISFKNKITEQFRLNVRDITNRVGHNTFRNKYGELYKTDPDQCCYINKVEPLERELKKYKGWITGIRKDQTGQRKKADYIQKLSSGIHKFCPVLDWTNHDVWTFVHRNALPEHPLLSKGYLSVGCAPCTAPVAGRSKDERGGRWEDRDKNECGLHTTLGIKGENENT